MSNETIREPAREVSVVHECDLCVIGGSCTGVFAAVAAARLGARVALVEQQGFFGGVATAGLVNIWHKIWNTENTRRIIAGLTTEVVDRLRKRGGVVEVPPDHSRQFLLNPAELVMELDELVSEQEGIRPFLHTKFVQPVVEEGRVTAAMIEDKTGRRAIRAKLFIDASGDGDLAARAGLESYFDDYIQPPTVCGLIHGLERIRQADPEFDLGRLVHDPQYPNALKHGFLWHSRATGLADTWMVAGTRAHGANCADADQLTQAELQCRRQLRAICDIVREHVPGGENIAPAAVSSYIGIRESRHIRCLHTLTEQEVLEGVRFHDAIANGSYRVDIHHADRSGLTFRYLDGTEEVVAPGEPRQNGRWREQRQEDPTFYQIPYRCLVPRGASNVLIAGRSLDADRGAFGGSRVMVNCNQMGQAAGVAAHVALDSGADVADIDTGKLRETLSQQGAIVL